MHWFTLAWWKYLLAPLSGAGRIRTTICRIAGHPAGPIWYNPNGEEPDWRCKNCGDYLG